MVRPWDSIRRSGHDDEDGTASVVLYESVQADDGFCRSKLCRQGRVLRFVTDATDDEITAAAAEGTTDRRVYWAHFGVGTAAYKSAIMAAGRFEADGVPTRTGRLGGDRWRYVEARARTTDAEFCLETSGGSTSHPQSGLDQRYHGHPEQVFGAGY